MTTITQYLSQIGKRGGESTSAAKKAASKANGSKPCRPGKKRGRPLMKKA
jgi:hypothetical protein